MLRIITVVTVGVVAMLAACESGGGGPTDVDATGAVAGLVWLDRNGTEELEGSDLVVGDVKITLRRAGGGATVASGTSAKNSGQFVIRDVPVGDYLAEVDATTVGDTLSVMRVDSANVRVTANDTSLVLVGLTFPSRLTAEVRELEPETRVFIEGLGLNGWATFGDSTLHVRDAAGAIRIVRAPPVPVGAGDSLRVLATTAGRAGQVVLKDATIFLLRTGTESPAPVSVETGTAAIADAGSLDADLVRIADAEITDTTAVATGDYRLTVDDGSGEVIVLLDRNVPFSFSFGEGGPIGRWVRVTGLLVPDESGAGSSWVVKPRAAGEVEVLPES